MNLTTVLAIMAIVNPILSASGVVIWFTVGPQRRKLKADADKENTDTQSQIIKDLTEAYRRINDELLQTQMRVKACEEENTTCRNSVALLQFEVGRQSRLSALARARSHVALKTLGSYELHIDFLLDEMRDHGIEIIPIMRTSKLRTAFQSQLERLEAMEVQELEILLKQQLNDAATIQSSSETKSTDNL